MNTKGIKFLAVLAVLAMAFAAFAVLTDVDTEDAGTSAPIGDFTFEFGGEYVDYGTYGKITVAEIQSLGAVAYEITKTIKLSGDLYKLSSTDASWAAYHAMYTDFTGHHGIAFKVSGLTPGTSTIQVAGGTVQTASADSEPCLVYLPDSVASTIKGKTTVVIDKDGAGAGEAVTITIDFSDCIKAQIGDKKYISLDDAVGAVKAGETITLLSDTVLKNVIDIDEGKVATIDLNENDISKANKVFELKHGTLTFTGKGTVSDTKDDGYAPVRITGSSDSTAKDYSVLNVGADVTLKGWAGVMISYDGAVANAHAYGVVVNISGTLQSPYLPTDTKWGGTVYINGSIQDKTGYVPEINVLEGATITGLKGHAIFAAGYANWTITGATVVGDSGIGIKAGKLTINDSEVKATGAYKAPAKNSDGIDDSGAAIQIELNAGYADSIDIAITNSLIKSTNGHAIYQYLNETSIKSLVINGGVFESKAGEGAKENIKVVDSGATPFTVNGGSFQDLSALSYVADNKEITITGPNVVAKNAKLTVKSTITLNFAAGSSLVITPADNTGATVENPNYTLINKGTINVEKGANVTGWDTTLSEDKKYANVKAETGSAIKFDGDDVVPEKIKETEAVKVTEEINSDIASSTTGKVIIEAPASNVVANEAAIIDVGSKEVAFMGNGADISKLNISVGSSSGNGSVSFSGFHAVSGTITTTDGSVKQTIELKNMKGTFTISRGSVIIDGVEYSGEIVLNAGDVVKISGDVSGDDFKISMNSTAAKTDKATVIVEAGDEKTLEILDHKLIINDSRITLQVDGKLFGAGTIESKGKIIVDDEGELAVTSIKDKVGTDAASAITLTAKAGSTVSGAVYFDNTSSSFVVYSGADISGVTEFEKSDLSATIYDQFAGKDAEDGSWSVTTDGSKLTLNNYNGTFNFVLFNNDITQIELNGDSDVSFAFPETYVAGNDILLGKETGITSITSEKSGSLEIHVDLSKIAKDQLFQDKTFRVLKLGTPVSTEIIDGVDLSIVVSGENSTWTADETKNMQIIGIDASKSFKTFNASIGLNIMSAYTSADADKVIALNVAEGLDVDNAKVFGVESAGTGVKVAANGVKISNSALVGLEGNKAGLVATGQALDIKTVAAIGIEGGMTVGDLTVKESSFGASGKVTVAKITGSNSSTIGFTGEATIGGNVKLTQESVLNLNDATINGATFENGGVVTVKGNVLVSTATAFTNTGSLTNEGLIGVYGNFKNQGSFDNEGVFEVYKYEYSLDEKVFTVKNDDRTTTENNVRISSITLKAGPDNVTSKADGTAAVKATIAFLGKTAGDDDFSVDFDGILTPAIDGGYKLVLTNKDKTATVTLTYTIVTTPESKIGGKSYALTVSGTVKNAEKTYYLAPNASTAEKDTDTIASKFVASEHAKFLLDTDSVTVSTGTFIVSRNYSAGADEPEIIKGLFTGDLTTNIKDVTISGDFLGDLTANGDGTGKVTLSALKKMVGDITADGAVVIKGTFNGNITSEKGVTSTGTIKGEIVAKGNVTVKNLDGNITVNANGDLTVTVTGKMDGNITYNSKYKATKDAKEGEETTYTATMHIDGETKDTGFTIILAAGADATASAAVVPGFFKINGTMADLAVGKTVELTLTEGKLLFDAVVKMKANYYLIIEKDTTIEVNKSAASLDVTEAALKVSKDATSNFETGSGTPVNYGKVIAIMSFTIDDGAYTIYSDVAYALTNCNENSTLTVESDAPINSNVSVKNGVNIIVKNVTLTFNGLNVKMGDGAKITLEGTGKVIFKKSLDNVAEAELDKDLEYEYYSVSGTIVYGDNEVEFAGVRFTADSTVVGVAATSTAVAKISTTLLYDEGTVRIASGTGTGSITLSNDAYPLVKADKGDLDKATLVFGTFLVGSDAVFDAVSIVDEFGKVKYINESGEIVVDKIRLMPTIVGVEGTLNLTANVTTIKGTYVGLGTITIAAGKEVTFAKSAVKAVGDNVTIPANVAAKFVDTTDDQNGYVFNLVAPKDNASITLKATTQKIGTETYDVMTISGDVAVGAITGTTEAFVKGLTIEDKASLFADEVYIVGDSTAIGYLGAKEIYMKEGTGASDFATLTYEVTFEEEGYTVYTYFASIDFDEITDITIAKDLSISGMTDGDKLDLSGKDVNIVIAEGKKLTIDKPLIIGTPIDSLGGYSSISGKVVILSSQYESLPEITKAYRYIVVYSDVDLSEAEIYQANGKDEAVYSTLVVDDLLYATIFANEGTYDGVGEFKYKAGVGLAIVDKSIIPDIEGYVFTKWSNLNDDLNAAVGETSAYANAKAILVTVTVKFAEGVSYYCDGVEFAIYDTPTKVEYNSVFTAKINNTAKYEGTPLINGKNSFIVTEDATLTVTGVNPIPVPPEPEPEPVVGDSGLSLTDILLIVLVILIAIMVVILVLRLNRS